MAFYWNVHNFEELEPEMGHYSKMKKERKKNEPHSKIKEFFYINETKLKMFVSFLIFLGMVKILK